MQKSAQKRTFVSKVKEFAHPRALMEHGSAILNPEFKQIMDKLRTEVDDPVRAILSGESVGQAPAPDDAIGIKDLLKRVKSNVNRREYMTAVADLGRFHKKLYEASKILSNFKVDVDKIHEKFLFEGLDEDVKKHLHELKTRIANKELSFFVKESGIIDFFTNIVTERGRDLSAWEKRYPKKVGKLKTDTNNLLKKSESVLNNVLSILKDLSNARASRNVDNYLKLADKFVKIYENYDSLFKTYYNENVKNFLEKQEFMFPAQSVKAPEIAKQEVAITPKDPKSQVVSLTPPTKVEESVVETVVPSLSKRQPIDVSTKSDSSTKVSVEKPESEPITQEAPTKIPDTIKDEDIAPDTEKMPISVKSHYHFYQTLEKMQNEHPRIIASYIKKYATNIQYTDLKTSLALFKLLKNIEV